MARIYEKNYFTYRGKNYGYGTVVKLKPEMYRGIPKIENCNGVMEFYEGLTSGVVRVRIVTDDIRKKGGMDIMVSPEDAIECIITPVYAELRPTWEKALENYHKTDKYHRPDTFLGTLLYIIIMIGGTLFYDRILIWVVATIVYLRYMINKYRD
jgi:hypothetical protein